MIDAAKNVRLTLLPLDAKHAFDSLCLRKKYRSHFEIMASMVEVAKSENAPVFAFMRYASISYTLAKRYLTCLADLGLIELDSQNGKVMYRANERGLEFLRQYYVLHEILSNSARNKNASYEPKVERSIRYKKADEQRSRENTSISLCKHN